MSIFNHEFEAARRTSRMKGEKAPPPLPPTTRGTRLSYRMKRKFTRAETASSLVVSGTTALAIGLLATGVCLYFVDYSRLSDSPFLLGGAAFFALVTLLGVSVLWDGFSLRRVAHIDPPQIELDEIDLRCGGSYRLAFIQVPSTRLENVTVDLVCDETLIETVETVCLHGDDTPRRAGHYRAADGSIVERNRVPHESRVHEQRIMTFPEIDATRGTFGQTGTFAIPDTFEPTGESTDHKSEWKLILDGSVVDGPSLREVFTLRVRGKKNVEC